MGISARQTLCLTSVLLTVNSNFRFRVGTGFVSSVMISSAIWPAGTATTKYIQACYNTNTASKSVNYKLAIYSLCCPCIVTKNFCPMLPVCRFPCWSVTMVMTLWPSSPTRCWMAESTESAAIPLSAAPAGI